MAYPAKERENALELTVRTLASKYGILSTYNLSAHIEWAELVCLPWNARFSRDPVSPGPANRIGQLQSCK